MTYFADTGDNLVITFTDWSATCAVGQTVTKADGSALDSSVLTFNEGTTVSTLEFHPAGEGINFETEIREYKLTLTSVVDSSISESINFTIQQFYSSCTNVFRSPSEPYLFDDLSYIIGSGSFSIPFDNIDQTDCPFQIEVNDPNNGISSSPYTFSDVFTVAQPTLAPTDATHLYVSVSQYGSLAVETSDTTYAGEYNLQLTVKTLRHALATDAETFNFKLTLIDCNIILADDSEVIEVAYTLGDPEMELGLV